LGDDFPFYALEPQGLETDDPVHRRVEDMAAHYIRELKTVQPYGPYRIGGHCAGGWVAFEMARQLRASGDHVERLVVVDVEPPGIRPPKTKWGRYLMSRLILYGRGGRLIDALRWQLALQVERVRIPRSARTSESRVREVQAMHSEAHRLYQGGLLDADLMIVRSEEWSSLPDKEWHLKWSHLVSGEMEVTKVVGAHSALLHGRSVSDLGAVIRQAFRVR
jgi:thioesterase domain-containing protein